MRKEEIKEASGVMQWLLGTALGLLILAMMFTSCTRTVYEPVAIVRTEYVEADTTGLYERMRSFFESMYRRDTSTDSVIDRSKETVVLKENGDTTRHDREHIVYVSSRREKELEHKLYQRDSIINALQLQLASVKSDTIRIPYPVERKLSRWEQTKMDFGGMAIGGIAIAVCIAVICLIKKIRSK